MKRRTFIQSFLAALAAPSAAAAVLEEKKRSTPVVDLTPSHPLTFPVSDEMLEDGDFNIESVLTEDVAQEFAFGQHQRKTAEHLRKVYRVPRHILFG